MFELEEKKFETETKIKYSSYSIVNDGKKIFEFEIPKPVTDFTKDIYLKYQSIDGLLKRICTDMNENKASKEFGREYDDFIYRMSGSSAYIFYAQGDIQMGYANTGAAETTEKFVQNLLSLIVDGKQLYDWNECYEVSER